MIELAGVLVLGIFAQWIAYHIRVPAILPLILVGLMVGPVYDLFIEADGKLIDGDKIFQKNLLFDFVSLSVGIILFEGGLTLKFKEVKALAGTLRNLLIIGITITLAGGTWGAIYFMGLNPRIALLFGALIIVSGPSVIGPILRSVKPVSRVNTILKWEGILIDPLGALIAVLLYEFIISGKTNAQFTFFAFKKFLVLVGAGLLVGLVMAFLVYILLRKKLIPSYLRNVSILALVMLAFTLSDMIHAESGLLAVTVMGIILSNIYVEDIKHILSFKEDVTIILISILFILLSSRIDLADIRLLGGQSLLLFGFIVLILRPLSVIISTINSGLSINEKLFISWVYPRGIVSAAVASLFSIQLTTNGPHAIEGGNMLLPLTFLVILGTVILQGLTAKPLARALGVVRTQPNGILFLGANEAARYLAVYLRKQGIPVLLSDTSKSNIVEAKTQDLPVYEGSILAEDALEDINMSRYGQMVALTSNMEVNMLCCQLLAEEMGEGNVYRLASKREYDKQENGLAANILFRGNVDFITFIQAIRKKPDIKQEPVNLPEDFKLFLKENGTAIIPLFILRPKKQQVIPVTVGDPEIQRGDQLVYIEK